MSNGVDPDESHLCCLQKLIIIIIACGSERVKLQNANDMTNIKQENYPVVPVVNTRKLSFIDNLIYRFSRL